MRQGRKLGFTIKGKCGYCVFFVKEEELITPNICKETGKSTPIRRLRMNCWKWKGKSSGRPRNELIIEKREDIDLDKILSPSPGEPVRKNIPPGQGIPLKHYRDVIGRLIDLDKGVISEKA